MKCGFTATADTTQVPLASELAAPLPLSPTWIDIAISAEEPAKVALLGVFLADNGIEFEQSRRFVSIPAHHAEHLTERIHRWAFDNGMVEDERSPHSLATTMREIGMAVVGAIVGNVSAAEDYANAAPGTSPRIDLR